MPYSGLSTAPPCRRRRSSPAAGPCGRSAARAVSAHGDQLADRRRACPSALRTDSCSSASSSPWRSAGGRIVAGAVPSTCHRRSRSRPRRQPGARVATISCCETRRARRARSTSTQRSRRVDESSCRRCRRRRRSSNTARTALATWRRPSPRRAVDLGDEGDSTGGRAAPRPPLTLAPRRRWPAGQGARARDGVALSLCGGACRPG